MKSKVKKTEITEKAKQRNTKILTICIYGLAIGLFVGSVIVDVFYIKYLNDELAAIELERDVCQTSKNVDLAMCQYVLGGCFQALRTK